jgi:transcription elongation factor Elf1
VVGCSSCGLKQEFQAKPAQGEVDIYCMFTDAVYGSARKTPAIEGKLA